jgi:hypothetical protein
MHGYGTITPKTTIRFRSMPGNLVPNVSLRWSKSSLGYGLE